MVDILPRLLMTPAWAQTPGASPSAGGGSPLFSLVPFLLIFVLFYVLMILPQQRRQKRHREMLKAIKKGDRVVTTGGMLGSVTNIHDDVVTLQVSDNVKVKILRSAIASLRDEPKQKPEIAKESKPQIKSKPSESIKKLHREIAKRAHPDLAQNDGQRTHRQQLMAEANRAYEENDEARLQEILRTWESVKESKGA